MELLKTAGLTGVQSEILEYLLKNDGAKASRIAKEIKRPRGVIYKGLEELLDLKLIERFDRPNQISVFRAEHPGKIEKLFETREKELAKNKKSFLDSLPDLVSAYNLSHNKPGVKFYEGLDGVRQALDDTLKSKTEIYTINDPKATRDDTEMIAINEEYVKERRRKKIKKKIIAPISSKLYFKEKGTDELTEIRYADDDFPAFKTAIQIYDGKVSYQTQDQENKIAVIIEDPNIYLMQKLFFEFLWKKCEGSN